MRSEVRGPGGEVTECEVKDNADGTYAVEYTPYEQGKPLPPATPLHTHTHCVHMVVSVPLNGWGGLIL